MRQAAAFVLSLCLVLPIAQADVKYTTQMKMAENAPAMSTTTYVKGQHERVDMNMMGMELTTVTLCDRRQVITINHKCKMYQVAPLDPEAAPAPGMPMPMPMPAAGGMPGGGQASSGPPRKGGVVKVESEIRDTGERQKMFGLDARRVVMRMKMEAGADACSPGRGEMENDMWLVNLAGTQLVCRPKFTDAPPPMPSRPSREAACRDKFEMSHKGGANMEGFPVKTVMTWVSEKGERFSMTNEITDLSTATLDASMFQPPAGYTEAKDTQQLYMCGMGIGNIAEAMARGAQQPAAGEATAGAPAPAGAATGLPSICPVTLEAENLNAASLSDMLVRHIRQSGQFASNRIDATDSAGIQKEAADKKCSFVLYNTITEARTKRPRIGGLLGRAAGVGGDVRPEQEIRSDYRLVRVEPFDRQVARDRMNHSQQSVNMEEAVDGLMQKVAARAVDDARRAK